MSNGRFRTFDEFGSPPWNATQSPSAQRAAVQSAFDSGEPLLMPCGEDVQLDDVGLSINNSLRLIGHGCDITNTARARSQFRTAAANSDMLRVLANNVVLDGFNLHADALGGRGLVIGDGTPAHVPFGTRMTGLSTGSNLSKAVEILSGQQEAIMDCWFFSQDAAICLNDQVSADQGDRRVRGGELNAAGPTGAGLLLLSGGGLIFEGGTKFLNCFNHIKVDWRKGGSGSLIVEGCSMENCRGPISVDIDGNQPFVRMTFVGNSCGNSSVAIAVRNYQPTPWLRSLIIADNNIDMGAALPAFDLGSVAEISVSGNVIDGGGVATAGIVVRRPCEGSIGTNTIRNLGPGAPKIQNADGANVNIAPFQG